tara:strand:- start:3432 stop:3848 length:417 start_codon:yes stop_codon:yes gene_type:complete
MRFAGMALDGSNYVNAAMNSGGAMEGILAKNTPNYTALSGTASAARSSEKVAGMDAQAMLQNAGISSLANMQASAFGANAIKAQGEAQASATRSQGLSNMIGSIGGGIIGGLKPKASTTEFGSLEPSNFSLDKNFWLK